ncbi:hypothetical protein GIB67_029600 [Kingdonia uniflora]|uniref:Pentatricopeptide repeat-containing protein n=1 Tax=Kingdonia uniflora TaxID=39325 RepID=A0A7J7LL83_9MAGN|nr:hypothetical protein GIB67_029600 [Kingdonia uniflora]
MIGIRFALIFEVQFRGPDLQPQLKEFTKVPVKSHSHSSVKALCMKKETVDDALRVFREIPDHGCIPDSYTYGTLINGLYKLGKISEAKELFEEMDAKDCAPTVVTYTSLIHGGLCKEGKVPDAVQILDIKKFQGLIPDGVLYGRLVNSLCNSSMFQKVANLLDEMVPGRMLPIYASWSLHVNNHNMVVSGLCTEKDLNRAFQINLSTRIKNISVDSETYKYLVGFFSKKGDVYKASHIVNEMLLEGFIPDEWNAVVCGFLHRTKVKEVADVVFVELIGNFLEARGALFHAEEASVFNMKEQVFTKSLNACSRAILMEMLDQSGGASSISDSVTTPIVNGTGLTLPTLSILGLTLLGLALDPSRVGLPATSQSILVLIVPEGFYSVIVYEVIREEAYLFVESRTLGNISIGEVVAWLKIFTIIQ